MGKFVDIWAKSWTSPCDFVAQDETLEVSLTMQILKSRQVVFYLFVLLFGFGYQPNWVYENFWSKADFWEVLPFVPSFYMFLSIYAISSTLLVYFLVQLTKKHL